MRVCGGRMAQVKQRRGCAKFGKKFASVIGLAYKERAYGADAAKTLKPHYFSFPTACVNLQCTGREVRVLTEQKKHRSLAPTTVVEPGDLKTLSPEEEKVLRMAHGLTEADSHTLSFALGADHETRLKLALMEKELLEAFQRAPAPDLQLEEHHIDAKARIIDRLRKQ